MFVLILYYYQYLHFLFLPVYLIFLYRELSSSSTRTSLFNLCCLDEQQRNKARTWPNEQTK